MDWEDILDEFYDWLSHLAERWDTDVEAIFELLSETKQFQDTGELDPTLIARFENYVKNCAEAGGISEAEAFEIIYEHYQFEGEWISVDEFYTGE